MEKNDLRVFFSILDTKILTHMNVSYNSFWFQQVRHFFNDK